MNGPSQAALKICRTLCLSLNRAGRLCRAAVLRLELLFDLLSGIDQNCSSFLETQPRRLSFGGFGTLRKKRVDDGEEFVCPMNVEMPKSASFQRARAQVYGEEPEHLEQVGGLLGPFAPDLCR